MAEILSCLWANSIPTVKAPYLAKMPMSFSQLFLLGAASTAPVRDSPTYFNASRSKMDDLSRIVVEAAVEVQNHLGSGLLRSAYAVCLFHELGLRGLKPERTVPANVIHREQLILSNKQVPLIVENSLMVTCHCMEKMDPLHLAKARSLLKASSAGTGLCINFHATNLAGQIKRISLQHKEFTA